MTAEPAATAALDPEPTLGPGPGSGPPTTPTRIARAHFRTWEHQLTAEHTCSHPIQLRSRTDMIDTATGELAPLVRPGLRRVRQPPRGRLPRLLGHLQARRPPARPRRARRRQGHPRDRSPRIRACSPRFTAPSFGPVHSRRMRGKTVLPCRPRRDAKARRCPHGRDISCPTRHLEADPRLGQPMCPDCYDYQAAVLFNAYAADLWRRFTTYLPRQLARRQGMTQKDLRALARIRFVKVAEYQARGVVHFHAVIRLDAPGEDYQPPPPGITAEALCDAIGLAAAAAAVVIEHQDQAVTLGFGTQTDTRIIRHGTGLPGTGQALNGAAVANYIAKYATKTLTAPGLPSCRIRSDADIERLRCPAHYQRLITTAWQLGTRYRAWAHMLGYGGHFLTKSRRYSVTFGQLRAARTEHRRAAASPGRRPRRLGPPPGRDRRPGPARHLDLRRHRPPHRRRRRTRPRRCRPRPRASRPGRQRRITNLPADQGRSMNT